MPGVRPWGLLLLLLVSPLARAQDAHYWTRQFGNRAWLLGGAFISNPGDISAVYYNPGALALLRTPELELTGTVFESTSVTVQNGQGNGQGLTESRLDVLPSLIAGSLRWGFLGKSRLAYSLLTRQGFTASLESHEQGTGMNLGGVPGMDQLAADVRLDQDVGEYWAGLTWSFPLGKHVGVGVSPFAAVRDQETNIQVLAQGSGSGGSALLSTLGRDFHLRHVRLLAKLGVSYQREHLSAGLTVTTPSVALWGEGESNFERAILERGFGLSSLPASAFDFQDGLEARFHSSWAVALGVGGTLGSSSVYLAAEGFARVKPFTLVDASPFSPRDSQEVIDPDVDFALAPLVNVALGVEQRLGSRLRAYLSAHTDFSGETETSNMNALLSGWDLYHVATGLHFTVGRSRFTLGGNVAFGQQTTERLADAVERAGLQPLSASQKIRFLQLSLIIGASFALVEKDQTADEDTADEAPEMR
ncbi:hypothetical protein [Myxococcus eversor]|uniref:hypothetical protein n=1 Tax=Myxococcus eversor TaxID=2709661 RepID=UPI0013D19874|nr:hypothetical protein [Myxococcus eversor]